MRALGALVAIVIGAGGAGAQTAARMIGDSLVVFETSSGVLRPGAWSPAPDGAVVRDGRVRGADGAAIGTASGPGRYVAYDVVEPGPHAAAFAPSTWCRGVAADDPAAWRVAVDGAPVEVVAAWRRSAAERLAYTADGPRVISRHVVTLALARPAAAGATVSVDPPGAAAVAARAVAGATAETPAVQVSQIGYEPRQSKLAFAGLWFGRDRRGADGATDALLAGGRSWRLVRAPDGGVVASGPLRLERRGAEALTLEDGAAIRAGHDVWVADFSAVTTPGVYRLVVDGLGASAEFPIRRGVALEAMRAVARGFFHLRRGQVHGPPHTAWRRPAILAWPHRISSVAIAPTTEGLGRRDKFEALRAAPWRGHATPAFGWQDAGDYDTRPQQLRAARELMRAGAMLRRFAALDLGLPESGRPYDRVVAGRRLLGDAPLPDFLHEALWGIDHWRDAQLPSGAVRGGFELDRYTRRTGFAGWDRAPGVESYAYAPDPWASFAYAATAAMAARTLQALGEERLGRVYWRSAQAAFDYAVAEEGSLPEELRASWRYRGERAAALLQTALAASTLGEASAPARHAALGRRIDLADPGVLDDALDYLMAARGGLADADPMLVRAVERRIEEDLARWRAEAVVFFGGRRFRDERWRFAAGAAQPRATARVLRHAYLAAPPGSPARAELARWIERDPLFGLGANPVGMTVLTGIGRRPPTDMVFADLRALGPVGMPPGIALYGPVSAEALSGPWIASVYAAASRPRRARDTPYPYLWHACGCYVPTSEFTLQSTQWPWLWSLGLIDAIAAES